MRSMTSSKSSSKSSVPKSVTDAFGATPSGASFSGVTTSGRGENVEGFRDDAASLLLFVDTSLLWRFLPLQINLTKSAFSFIKKCKGRVISSVFSSERGTLIIQNVGSSCEVGVERNWSSYCQKVNLRTLKGSLTAMKQGTLMSKKETKAIRRCTMVHGDTRHFLTVSLTLVCALLKNDSLKLKSLQIF